MFEDNDFQQALSGEALVREIPNINAGTYQA